MSVLRNPVQKLALTTQAGLIRLLLDCRFDFRHKIWSAPRFEPRLDDRLSSALDRDALLPLLSAVTSDFFRPSLGRRKIPKSAVSPDWNPVPAAFGKTKNQKGKMKLNLETQIYARSGQRAAGVRPNVTKTFEHRYERRKIREQLRRLNWVLNVEEEIFA
jgi:hypothetical protein